MKRRQFLQFTGSTFATLSFSQFDVIQRGDKYAQVLAQNTGRKYALLVGINKYSGNINPLQGCINDVLLQKELLTHRFGFNPNDIKILTDQQATRQGILTAFEEHLIKQAQPGDVVVFHFSGHGSQVVDPDKDNEDGLNSTLVPIDSEYDSSGGGVQDIMGHTLFLLMYALKTDNVTVVLDSCHSGGAKRGNYIVRSREREQKLQASPEEFAYQQQWLKRLNLSPQEFIKLRRQGVAKGVVIAAAKRDQYAADVPFNDFHAGAFTYLFTQYLWQKTTNESVKSMLVDVNRSTNIVSRDKGYFQNPELELNSKNPNPITYFSPFKTSYAEAVVTRTQGDQVELWLGGLDTHSLDAFNKDATFLAVDETGRNMATVKLESRQGLVGQGKLISTTKENIELKPGTLLQENIRVVPNNLTLKVGLDDTFDSKTINQAQQALQTVKRITVLPLGQQEIQYIFARMTETRYQQLQKSKVVNLPPVGSFGLFLPSLDQIVPSSFHTGNETITAAVQRLKPKFKSLLAARIVKQMLPSNTSQVKATASMSIAGSKQIISETLPTRGTAQQTGANTTPAKPITIKDGEIAKLPLGTKVLFEIENKESTPIYVTVLVVSAEGEMGTIFPNDWATSDDAALLAAGEKRIIPGEGDDFKLTIRKPLGITEVLIIASTLPLRTSLKALKDIARRGNITRGPIAPNNDEFLEIIDKLLEDVDTETPRGISVIKNAELAAGVKGVDAKKLAAMAINFEIVT